MARDEGHDERDLKEDRQPRNIHHILKEIIVLSIKNYKGLTFKWKAFKKVKKASLFVQLAKVGGSNIIIISKACILTKLFKELNHLLRFDWLASHAWKDIK